MLLIIIITLLTAGALLLVLASFLPGKAAARMGLVALGAAVVLGYWHFDFRSGNLILAVVMLTLVVAALVWLGFCPVSRTSPLILARSALRGSGSAPGGAAFGAATVYGPAPGDAGSATPELLNRMGVAIGQLQPSGAAFVNGQRLTVVTAGPLIDRGAPIKVIAVESGRIVVREV
jgi:hypothetical protein